jgi:hypothetical protein
MVKGCIVEPIGKSTETTYWRVNMRFFIMFCIMLTHFLAFCREGDKVSDYTLAAYDIKVFIPEDFSAFHVIAGLWFENAGPVSDTLWLQLGGGFKGMHTTVTGIETGTKQPVPYLTDSSAIKLMIPAGTDLKNESIIIHYTLAKDPNYPGDAYYHFAGDITDSLFHVNASITRTDNWYPIVAGTFQERLPAFTLQFDFPKDFELVASGELIKEDTTGNRKSAVWKNYPVITDRSLFFYAARNYRKVVKAQKGLKVIMYVPRSVPDDSCNKVAALTQRGYAFMEDHFGEATGHEFKVFAFSYGFASGLNFAGVPESLFDNPGQTDNMGYPQRSFVHEISHTWWGNVVSFNSQSDYWLFEGFARYSELAALNPVIGMDLESFMYYRTKLACLPYLDYTTSISRSGFEENRQLQVVSSYYQGATLLYFIRHVIGPEIFTQTIRDFVSKYRNKRTDHNALIEEFQNHCDFNISELIREYSDQPGYAEYALRKLKSRKDGSCYYHQVEIINKGNKTILAPLLIASELDTTNMRIRIERDSSLIVAFRAGSANAVKYIRIDPKGVFPIREYNRKGIGATAFPGTDGKVRFFNVIPGTIAHEAGIRDGMLLKAVNRIPVQNKSFGEITGMLMQPAGMHIKLKVLDAAGKTRIISLKYH